jgi:hypothetical protein
VSNQFHHLTINKEIQFSLVSRQMTTLLFHTTQPPLDLIFYFVPSRKRVFRSTTQAHFRGYENCISM